MRGTSIARALVLGLLVVAGGCSSSGGPAPEPDAGGGDVGVPCTCPCGPVTAPPGTHCWLFSCDPFCGPGSGNAC